MIRVLLFSIVLFGFQVTEDEAVQIGKKIYLNECSGKEEKLVWWNIGEDFPSLGIGHFIWYPEKNRGQFEETFPALLSFCVEQGIELPQGFKADKACPWKSKEDFLDKKQEPFKKELQSFLSRTISAQTTFIAKRAQLGITKLESGLTEEKKQLVQQRVENVTKTWLGKYALIDYLNFKGEGTSQTERYKNQGWGLLQVLETMSDEKDALHAFAEAAQEVLKQRVRNAPPERNEERWLPGWLARIKTYSN
ncbi:MAG: hypothetical protein HYX67_08215 [Candidatus Melainabacteria bacterium]|nr:hypothetical protein [Candidatus Melainabacteria bacterium]